MNTRMLVCIAGFLLLLSACIKDPDLPGPDPDPEPEWLLERFTFIRANLGSPPFGDGIVRYYKWTHELTYDRRNKPVSHKAYYAAEDTIHLQPMYFDSLLYDHAGRVIEVITTQPGSGKRIASKKFYYNRNDTLPVTYELYGLQPPDTSAPVLQFRYRYIYEPNAVHEITVGLKGTLDSNVFAYNGGNYTHYFDFPPGTRYDEFLSYDAGPNAERFLNIKNGLVIEIPTLDRELPGISRNNWILKQGYNELTTGYRTITYNSAGLPVATELTSYTDNVPMEVYTVRFEYSKVE